MTRAEAILDEQRRARRVRVIVDFASAVLAQGRLDRGEAEVLVGQVRARVLELFPDGEATFELLYGRRFQRLVEACPPNPGRGHVLPFRRPSC